MTLDDNKRSSLIVGSQDSLDSLSKLKGGNIVSPQENKAQLRRKGHRKTGSKNAYLYCYMIVISAIYLSHFGHF